MNRYFIELSYRGTAYSGWQRQIGSPSVQQNIEESLAEILRVPTPIMGCGRTDTGVHARFAVAHFDSEKPAEYFDTNFVYHLNCVLNQDIVASRIYATNLHARFDAMEREYKYYIALSRDPFCRDASWQIITKLNIDAMREAAQYLLKYSDFTSFAKLHSQTKTNICHVTHCSIEHATGFNDNPMLVITIRSDRFLRGMVRGIVGTLVNVGRGRFTAAHFENILAAQDRQKASAQAPAQGLFLTGVKY